MEVFFLISVLSLVSRRHQYLPIFKWNHTIRNIPLNGVKKNNKLIITSKANKFIR